MIDLPKDNTAVDREKKKLYESIEAIANADDLQTIARVLQIMYHRKQHCRAGLEVKASKELISVGVEAYNQQIKNILAI